MKKEMYELMKNYKKMKNMRSDDVTDKNVQMLRLLIEKSIQQTTELQKTYRRLIGRDYVPYGRL